MRHTSAPDRRAYALEWLGKLDVSSLFGPAADPASAGHAHRHRLGQGARVLYGRVLDAIAYAHCYRVAFEQGHPPTLCTALSATSLLPIGARALHALAPGTRVWAIVHPQLHWGLIIGAEPAFMTDPTLAMSDFLHQASRCGLRVDQAHGAAFNLGRRGSAIDFSAGRPFDGTTAGEWGAIAETGTRIALDGAMAQLAVDEATGVFAFYHDQLLRLCGVNWQAFSGGHEEEILVDELEVRGYRGTAVYPWEQWGAFARSEPLLREYSAQASQVDEPHYAALEPADDRQQPFHRVVELSGYLGQGGKRLVLAPPASGLNRYGPVDGVAALLEEHRALTGRYTVRSAKGISLEKRISIPAPRRLRRPEDPAGDAAGNYRSSGVAGEGAEHRVAGQVGPSSADQPHLQQAAAAADAAAYAFNWEGLHPLHYHAKDWALGKEADTPLGAGEQPLDFAALAEDSHLARPDPVEFRVDPRYGSVPYFPNRSYFTLLDDGGVVIGDGYGAEIRMTGGKIQLTAPGDVEVLSGKNFNVLAGFDVILRAKHSLEQSASEGDVRLKAERNFHVLAGNGGSGGVLIESRAPAAYEYKDRQGEDVVSGGVQVKVPHGDLAVWSRNIYLRTGGGDVDPGEIVLDAARGRGSIRTYSADFERYLSVSATDAFGGEGNVSGTATYGPAAAYLPGSLVTGGSVAVLQGGMAVNGSISVAGGHIGTELAPSYRNLVGTVAGHGLDQLVDSLDEADGVRVEQARLAADRWREAFERGWYAADAAGADATIEAVAFSFRTSKQYRVEDYALWEARWQQLARLTSGKPAVWSENPVESAGGPTMPYPGREKWAGEDCLVEQDLAIYDAARGVAKDRSDPAYQEPRFPEPRRTACDGNYAVII